MAGIGFELKKLFQKRGLAATAKAYGYAGVICTGPMLLGIVLLVGIAFICDHTGATRHNRELLNCMITYTLLVSLTVTSFFSMVVTRYIADMLYEERHEAVLSSFWGSTAILLVVGGIMYGIFLLFSGIDLIDQFLCPGVFRRIDRHLECDELSDSDQGLQRDSYFIYYSGSGIIVGRIPIDPDWDSTCRGVDDRSYDRLWNHAALGCDAVVPLFSAERDQCIFLFTLGGSVPSACVYRLVHEHRTICTSCYHVVRTDPCTCSGIVLWSAVS